MTLFYSHFGYMYNFFVQIAYYLSIYNLFFNIDEISKQHYYRYRSFKLYTTYYLDTVVTQDAFCLKIYNFDITCFGPANYMRTTSNIINLFNKHINSTLNHCWKRKNCSVTFLNSTVNRNNNTRFISEKHLIKNIKLSLLTTI